MTNKLKPCPLCGSENVCVKAEGVSAASVWCEDCVTRLVGESAAKAIAAWNNRFALADRNGIIEECAHALERFSLGTNSYEQGINEGFRLAAEKLRGMIKNC